MIMTVPHKDHFLYKFLFKFIMELYLISPLGIPVYISNLVRMSLEYVDLGKVTTFISTEKKSTFVFK